MTAKATAILVPIEMPCVCKKCLSSKRVFFKDRSHKFSQVYAGIGCFD